MSVLLWPRPKPSSLCRKLCAWIQLKPDLVITGNVILTHCTARCEWQRTEPQNEWHCFLSLIMTSDYEWSRRQNVFTPSKPGLDKTEGIMRNHAVKLGSAQLGCSRPMLLSVIMREGRVCNMKTGVKLSSHCTSYIGLIMFFSINREGQWGFGGDAQMSIIILAFLGCKSSHSSYHITQSK